MKATISFDLKNDDLAEFNPEEQEQILRNATTLIIDEIMRYGDESGDIQFPISTDIGTTYLYGEWTGQFTV